MTKPQALSLVELLIGICLGKTDLKIQQINERLLKLKAELNRATDSGQECLAIMRVMKACEVLMARLWATF